MGTKPRFCLIGLGNPGAKYRSTRHNIGFDWVDRALEGACFRSKAVSEETKFDALWSQIEVSQWDLHILKPQTFMNLSGQSLQKWKKKFQGPFELLVVLDEMDIELGRIKLKLKGSDAGHRGLRSIIEVMGTNEFPRLRLGVGRPPAEGADHVLSRFSPEEKEIKERLLEKSSGHLEQILNDGFPVAMNHINREDFRANGN